MRCRCSMFEYEASGLADVELQLVADARRVDREARHVVVAGAERVRAVVYDVAGPRDEVANRLRFLAAQAYEEFAAELQVNTAPHHTTHITNRQTSQLQRTGSPL